MEANSILKRVQTLRKTEAWFFYVARRKYYSESALVNKIIVFRVQSDFQNVD